MWVDMIYALANNYACLLCGLVQSFVLVVCRANRTLIGAALSACVMSQNENMHRTKAESQLTCRLRSEKKILLFK